MLAYDGGGYTLAKVAHPKWLTQWRVLAAALLNLAYDAMPAEYVSLIVTELGAIPPTSVPVILREYQQQPNM